MLFNISDALLTRTWRTRSLYIRYSVGNTKLSVDVRHPKLQRTLYYWGTTYMSIFNQTMQVNICTVVVVVNYQYCTHFCRRTDDHPLLQASGLETAQRKT